jgi:hypothetical protein
MCESRKRKNDGGERRENEACHDDLLMREARPITGPVISAM